MVKSKLNFEKREEKRKRKLKTKKNKKHGDFHSTIRRYTHFLSQFTRIHQNIQRRNHHCDSTALCLKERKCKETHKRRKEKQVSESAPKNSSYRHLILEHRRQKFNMLGMGKEKNVASLFKNIGDIRR
jgi:hypothetical protein